VNALDIEREACSLYPQKTKHGRSSSVSVRGSSAHQVGTKKGRKMEKKKASSRDGNAAEKVEGKVISLSQSAPPRSTLVRQASRFAERTDPYSRLDAMLNWQDRPARFSIGQRRVAGK
jgi:hypothetical protein